MAKNGLKINRPYYCEIPQIGGYWMTFRQVVIPMNKKGTIRRTAVTWSSTQLLVSKREKPRFNKIVAFIN